MAIRTSASRRANLLAVLCISAALLGCATAHSTAGRDFDDSKVSLIVKGKTTTADLIAMFGQPYSKRPQGDDDQIWTYSYADATAHAQAGPFGVRNVDTTGYKKNLFIIIKSDNTVRNFTLDEGPLDRTTTVRPGS
jgi:outer membrane protein assembly factor BamE (lipoprotein component of BamABCDE complex)